MSYWLITGNGTVVSRTKISRVTNIEAQTDENKAKIAAFDKAIQERLNNNSQVIVEGGKGDPMDWSKHPFDRDPEFQEELDHIVSNK